MNNSKDCTLNVSIKGITAKVGKNHISLIPKQKAIKINPNLLLLGSRKHTTCVVKKHDKVVGKVYYSMGVIPDSIKTFWDKIKCFMGIGCSHLKKGFIALKYRGKKYFVSIRGSLNTVLVCTIRDTLTSEILGTYYYDAQIKQVSLKENCTAPLDVVLIAMGYTTNYLLEEIVLTIFERELEIDGLEKVY